MAGYQIKGSRQISKNTCIECDKPCKIVKFAKSKHSKQSGMLWVCEDNHVHRQRKHELIYS